MSDATIFVSVIIATYNSGTGIQRVFDSLDSQSLGREHFEVIFVDDGSTDDTYQTVQNYAALHDNVKFARIENSGWPSKPRNVAVAMAQGEYLMFMDHDDTLYPDALEATTRYGREHGSDIVIPKEMKSNDPWWYLESLGGGSVPAVSKDTGFSKMLPMVPHKLYRREMYVDNQITFPERRRALWEDQYINVAAFRHAQTVSIQADTPFYLWHASDTNTSHTFDPQNEDFWDRLLDIMSFMDEQFAAPELKNARTAALALQVQVRVIDRLTRLLTKAPEDIKIMAFGHAKDLLEKYLDDDIYAVLPWRHKVLSHLLGAGRPDLMEQFQAFDLSFTYSNTAHDVRWEKDGLHLRVEALFAPSAGFTGILCSGDKTVWNLPHEIAALVPPELVDFDEQFTFGLDLALTNRASKITWFPKVTSLTHAQTVGENGSVSIVVNGECVVAPEDWDNSAGTGAGIWDLGSRSTYNGMIRSRPPVYRGAPLAALLGDAAVTAYKNNKQTLTIDSDQSLRSVVVDNLPATTRGHSAVFSLPLEGVQAFEHTDSDASLFLLDSEIEARLEQGSQPTAEQLIDTKIRLNSSAQGSRALGGFDAPAGLYSIYAFRSGKFVKSSKSMLVKATGHFIVEPTDVIDSRANLLFA